VSGPGKALISEKIDMEAEKRAYLELHIAVFLFGFTAILGDLIQLSALVLVWWRVLLTSISLLFLVRLGKLFREMPRASFLRFMGIGVLVAVHWLAFYGAIKLSNASIAVVMMATTSFFTSLIEPAVLRQRVKWYEIALGLVILPGMILIVNSTELSMMKGIWLGLAAALLAALFATFNKKLIHRGSAMSITLVELGSAWIFLSILLPFFLFTAEPVKIWPDLLDWIYLLVLTLLCTTLAYVLSLRSLRFLSAFAANLTINMEPVYGIVLAWVILKENKDLDPGFYIGAVIIIASVFSYPLLRKYFGGAAA
jgi:drug/metabolite transporter (DMT)-like permease